MALAQEVRTVEEELGAVVEEHRYAFLVGAAVVLGVAGFGAAWTLLRLIGFFTHLAFYHRIAAAYAEAHAGPFAYGLGMLAALVGANLLAGLAIRFGHPALSGHGIPEVMESVLEKESRIPLRVALLKPVFSALVIGFGSPFGAEGPIIQTGGAIGSVLGQLVATTANERKVLIACGAAAGMTGIFGTPIAAVLLPVELITFEFSLRTVALPAIAVAVAYVLRTTLLDAAPLFAMHPTASIGPTALAWCLAFGVLAGAEAAGITAALYWLEDAYKRIPGTGLVSRPVLGALFVGLVAFAAPDVLGVGYDLLRTVLNDQATIGQLAHLLVAKGAAWLVALASGTVGGVLAPLFIVAGATGGIVGHLVGAASGMSPGLVALVFMGAVFGAGARIVLTASLFAAEVTGNFAAVVPVLLATAVATIVAEQLLPYNIMTGKLVRRGVEVSLDYFARNPGARRRRPAARPGRDGSPVR